MNNSVRITFWIVNFLISTTVLAENSSLQITHLKSPVPAPALKETLLIYELQLVNQGKNTLTVGLIEIFDQNDQKLMEYSVDKLAQNHFVYNEKGKVPSTKIELEQGMGAFVYLWIPLTTVKQLPTHLKHIIWTAELLDNKKEAYTQAHHYGIEVSKEKPVVLSPPLEGKNWIAVAAPSPSSYHRRTILPIEGKFYLAQRYAIDWEQVCYDGKTVQGNFFENANWLAFGEPVYASADGIVSKMQDGVPLNTPPKLPTPSVKIGDIAGNYVIIKIRQNDRDYYVLNAHMQPGSIKVKEGDKIKQGQIIGLLGNSGNSAAPHLHLHVADANDPLKAEGVPFIFHSVNVAGKMEEIDDTYGLWKPFTPKAGIVIHEVMPVENQIFNFTQAPLSKCDLKRLQTVSFHFHQKNTLPSIASAGRSFSEKG